MKPSTIIRRIQSGKLIFRTPSDVPFTNDGSPNYEVCLNSLPQKLQYRYLYLHLPRTDICSVDLAAPRSKFGNVWLEECITLARVHYYNSPGHTIPDKTKCIRPEIPGNVPYPGAKLILTLPITPEPIHITEQMVSEMQSEYKSHFPRIVEKHVTANAHELYMPPPEGSPSNSRKST